MKTKIIIAMFAVAIATSCAPKNPLADLREEQRFFIFGDDESRVAFMGSPFEGKSASCNANDMMQGYSFSQADGAVLLESIRPSGVEEHTVTSISSNGADIVVRAKNGANLPFSLLFSEIIDDQVKISFDGEGKATYLRCIK
ncbi:MAG: hypothetical protein FD163_435 [Hyphomonadaceae bacterium]|nr:MAG: hypothetical protein FD128_2537 [Hyphomonadaceae bacterium]KAF0187160.1 MAG: hypothetical protein FD163_435 [Hyphomonadaceae bacterium]